MSEQDRIHEHIRSAHELASKMRTIAARDRREENRRLWQRGLDLAADIDRGEVALGMLAQDTEVVEDELRRLIKEAEAGNETELYGKLGSLAVSVFGSAFEVNSVLTSALAAGARTAIDTGGSVKHTLYAMAIGGSIGYATDASLDAIRQGLPEAEYSLGQDFVTQIAQEVGEAAHHAIINLWSDYPMQGRPLGIASLPNDLDVRKITESVVASRLKAWSDRSVAERTGTDHGSASTAAGTDLTVQYHIAARNLSFDSAYRLRIQSSRDENRAAERFVLDGLAERDRIEAEFAAGTEVLKAMIQTYNRLNAALVRQREGIVATIGKAAIRITISVVAPAVLGGIGGVALSSGIGVLLDGGTAQDAMAAAMATGSLAFLMEELRSDDLTSDTHAGLTGHPASAPSGNLTSPPDISPTTVAADAPTVDVAPTTVAPDAVAKNDILHHGRWDHLPVSEREQASLTITQRPWSKDPVSLGHMTVSVEHVNRRGYPETLEVGLYPTTEGSPFTPNSEIRVERPPSGAPAVEFPIPRADALEVLDYLQRLGGPGIVDQPYVLPGFGGGGWNCVSFAAKFLEVAGVELETGWFRSRLEQGSFILPHAYMKILFYQGIGGQCPVR